MAKIKGWKKTPGNYDIKYRWISNDGRRVVSVEKMTLSGWIPVMTDIGKIGMTDNYSDAHKMAIKYMRSHPNG